MVLQYSMKHIDLRRHPLQGNRVIMGTYLRIQTHTHLHT